VTLDELRKEADDVLAQRMMKGFYVAIDKTFSWRGRSWHKTTKGLVAPADRFWQQGASDFHGIELDGEKWQLPVGFVFGQNKTVPTYELDLEKKTATAKGSVARFEPLQLRYEYVELAKVEYYQLASGEWVRDRHIRVTTPAPRPADIGPSERWIDVDVSEQTLVVFEGDRPLYATLISTGKESRDKAKDHSTPRGRWRIREKHIASTMDGDGTAAGDLPYSIEDVPYVMFFHKAYATHGAFWHANYGVQMSHGCVNLAPLDAKWLFLNSAPALPDGYHGVWSTDAQPGSWVVVHD
jgi:lipoprotein-anchoring transpeptidase ErfK/SrfK